MINRDLQRVREDLATLKSALGWDLPFNGQSVLVSLAVGSGGLLWIVWWMQPYRLDSPYDVFAALGFMCLPLLVWLLYAAANGLDLGPRRWDFQRAGARAAISVSLTYAFFIWAIAANLVSGRFGISAMLFTLGATLLAVIAWDRSQYWQLGWAIGWMIWALLRLVTDLDGFVVIGLHIAIGGLAGAAIMGWQLRVVERLGRAH